MKKFFELCGDGIQWNVKNGQQHTDNIEMGSLCAGYIVTYGVMERGLLHLARHCVYPALRTIPNDTQASFQLDILPCKLPKILINGVLLEEYAVRFQIDGMLSADSVTETGIELRRFFYPSFRLKCNLERIVIKNPTDDPVTVEIAQAPSVVHSYGRGTKGVYVVEVSHDSKGSVTVEPNGSYLFHAFYSARTANEPRTVPDGEEEFAARRERIGQLCSPLKMDTGNGVLDTFYRFAKIRAGESIFQTRSGLLHSPGGQSYYAATWCNDEIEYAGPWFSMTGDRRAIEASMNAYRQYMPFMSDCYMRIPSSVVAEGLDIWEGAGDRGDAAMYLYGASMFALCCGNAGYAGELWPAIKWCAEYCERRKSADGVIQSDSDELEGRFPTDGKANLSTSSLCCGGLKLAALLADSFGEAELGREYLKRAALLESAVEKHFGAALHGFETYRYSDGFDTLRAWICLPVRVGMEKRLEGTLKAMFSNYLWTENGMLTCEIGKENTSGTVWDRSTICGLLSAFLAGKGDEIWDKFISYCEKRLLGDRVPYAVEAYPEGNKRHLSAESALFCRIITEGILGIRPEGISRFSFCPRLPAALNHLYLTEIHAFGSVFDIFVDRDAYRVEVSGKVVGSGENGKRVPLRL